MTCNGLNAALNLWISAYEPYLNAVLPKGRGPVEIELVENGAAEAGQDETPANEN